MIGIDTKMICKAMTQPEIENFRSEFLSLVYYHGSMLKGQAAHLTMMERFNKGGSHDQAILKAVENIQKTKAAIKIKLKGKSYDDWRSFSKILSVTLSRLKHSVNDGTKMKYQKQLDNLNFLTYKNGNNNTETKG